MTAQTKIIAVAIQKGGVGKTFVSCAISYLLAENSYPLKGRPTERHAYNVTIMDFDPQCNATQTMLVRERGFSSDYSVEQSTAQFFGWTSVDGESVEWDMDAPLPIAIPVPPVFDMFYEGKIKCIPGHKTALADADALDPELMYEVANRIRQYAYESDDDVIVIDCSPQLGVRQMIAMLAADHIITPINIDMYSEAGLFELVDTFNAVREANDDIQLHVLPNRIDAKSKENMTKLIELKEKAGEYMVESKIPYSNSISTAQDNGRPLWRKPPSGNDSLVGRQVREALSETLARCGIVAL